MSKKKEADACLELDGRTLEGGGQLLRIALCSAALTGTAVKINNIRGHRSSGGGLKAQHLACVQWLAHACNANVEGAEKGSKTLLFEPGRIEGDLSPAFKPCQREDGRDGYECRLDIGTAGSTGLALQAILPYILFTQFPSQLPVFLTVRGGTNVSGSPSFEYVQQVLLPTLTRIGFPVIQATLNKRGWSQGGTSIGAFTLEIPPRPRVLLPAFTLGPTGAETGRRAATRAPSRLHATFIGPASCHEHFRTVLEPAITYNFGPTFTAENANVHVTCEDSCHEKRLYLVLVATSAPSSAPDPDDEPTSDSSSSSSSSYVLARDWLYDRKIRMLARAATEMAERVCAELAAEWASGAWADEHLRDQLVIFQALAHGASRVYPGRDDAGEALREPSLHARTAEWVARQVLRVKFDADSSCDGYGLGRDRGGQAAVDGRASDLGHLEGG